MAFNGLYISTSGLLAAQAALEVTSNNIANAQTEGYTRRQIHFGEGVSSSSNINSKVRLLSGVQVSAIDRIRNSFLDNQIRNQNTSYGFDNKVAELSVTINDILGEPSDSGLSAKLNQFFQAASDLSANPELATAKTVFINAGDSLARAFNQIDGAFDTFQQSLNSVPSGEIPSSVIELNGKLEELLGVHRTAMLNDNLGSQADDLNDKRDLLLDQISELMDVTIDRDGAGSLRKLTIDVNASEARTVGSVDFLNHDSPIAGITAGNNSLSLSINNGNGAVTGPFTVNFSPNSSPREVVTEINNTFRAAGGEGEIASLDENGNLNISTNLVNGSVNNTNAEVNIVGGTGNTLTTLGLTAGTTNGTNATTETLLDSQGLYYKFAVAEGSFEVGTNPTRIELRNNDGILSYAGVLDKGFQGEIGGVVHMTNEIIPQYQNEVSEFAMSIKDAVNKILQLGTTAGGNQGAALFTGTSAADFSVDPAVVANQGLLAQGKTGAVSDGSIMAEIADLFFGSDHIIGDNALHEELYIDSPGSGPVTPVESVVSLVPGETITINADGIIDDGGSSVNAGQNGFGTGSLVQIQYRDASGAAVGGPIDFPASAGAPENRVSYTGTVPAGAATVEFVMNTSFNDGDLTNNSGHFSVQVMQGDDISTASNLNNKMADIVGDFGTQGNLAISNAENSGDLLQSLKDKQASISGVSVEEEAASLIQFQNAFAANARVMSTWERVYDAILNI